jgi:hypothetical protein
VAQQEKAGAKGAADRRIDGTIMLREPKAPSSPRAINDELEARRWLEIERKRRQILRMMDDEVKLDVPNDATLSQFLKAIKQATSDIRPPGLPIYVNRTGLVKDVGKGLEFPVDCIDLKKLSENASDAHVGFWFASRCVTRSSRRYQYRAHASWISPR